jgi:serine/threonine-protein kinase
MSEPDQLMVVAGAVAEGSPVAWDTVSGHATSAEDVATLGALRDLESLLSALRRIDDAYDTTPMTLSPPGSTEAPAPPPAPARWGHLVIRDMIGQGAFGTVYRAHDERLRVDVALKLLSPSATARPGRADRIIREARLLARVRHPNVVRVYGVDDAQQQPGLWMEMVEGQTLEALLRARGPFGAQEASFIGRDICRAMAAVHQAGVLHGDIKAHNVMREAGGRIVLMDFGSGQALTDSESAATAHVAGTPVYLAPEVLAGHPRSASSDIYALGVLLYHLVTGSYPVSGPSVDDLRAAHAQGRRRHLRDARPDLPDDFVRAVEHAMAADPSGRFESLGSLEDALVPVTSTTDRPRTVAGGHGSLVRARVQRWIAVPAAAIVVLGGATAVRYARPDAVATAPPPALDTAAVVATSGVAPASATYEIEAALYRIRQRTEERLQPGARVAPGDELYLKLQASTPLHLYVVNEDEKGAAFLLFPLPGQPQDNPLPAGRVVTLPGALRWRVTSAGEREHFLVFASPDPVESLEQAFARLPTPKEGVPLASAELPDTTLEKLRGVGGLTPAPAPESRGAGLSRLFTVPLTDAREQARGLWVRQITLDNPAR